MRCSRPTLVLVTLLAGVACARRPTPMMPGPATPTAEAGGPAAALALLRGALEQDGPRLRVRLPAAGAIALNPGREAGTWRFRCRCYAYVPASTVPWVYEATGTVEPARGLVHLHALAPPPELPTELLPSPVALRSPGTRRPM
ncbi:MAG: hypothetical protein VKS61_00085 [Candidatus Sericytochromatia bacterium]|nr:hypothetical protein [Candidatus Sericytochromatia bacterium]